MVRRIYDAIAPVNKRAAGLVAKRLPIASPGAERLPGLSGESYSAFRSAGCGPNGEKAAEDGVSGGTAHGAP